MPGCIVVPYVPLELRLSYLLLQLPYETGRKAEVFAWIYMFICFYEKVGLENGYMT